MSNQRKQKTGKSAAIGVLNQLTPEQQDELFDMLNQFTAREVLEKITAPAPQGWGIKTHITSLRRFHQRRQFQLLRDEIEEQTALRDSAPESSDWKNEALQTLIQKSLYSGLAPNGDAKTIRTACKFLVDIENLHQQRERIQLEKEKLELEKLRQLTQAINVSLQVSNEMTCSQFNKIMKNVNLVLDASIPELTAPNTPMPSSSPSPTQNS